MESPKVIYKVSDLREILKRDSIITDTLVYIMHNLNKIPSNIKMIGVATNILLGVFGIETVENGYICYRLYYDKNKLIIADNGFPLTNIGHIQSNIECNMNYLISKRILMKYSE